MLGAVWVARAGSRTRARMSASWPRWLVFSGRRASPLGEAPFELVMGSSTS
jgi:hypothetical protein